MELVATDDGPRCNVELVSTNPRIDPPWSYGTGLDGPPPLDVGGAPPKPIGQRASARSARQAGGFGRLVAAIRQELARGWDYRARDGRYALPSWPL
jgi:hypothetical protein